MRKWFVPLAAAAVFVAATPASGMPSAGPTEDAAERARVALSELDPDRVLSDPQYAKEVLRHADVLRAGAKDERTRNAADALRLVALMGVGRDDEALTLANSLTAAVPEEPTFHVMALALTSLRAPAKTVEVIEKAERSLTGAEAREEFRAAISDESVFQIIRALGKDQAAKGRFAEALLKLGLPETLSADVVDTVRTYAIKSRVNSGKVEDAKFLLGQVRDVGTIIGLLSMRRYDPLFAPEEAGTVVGRAVKHQDEFTRAALSAQPSSPKVILQRAQHLRAVGRETDALQLLLPYTKDVAALPKLGTDAFWLANEASYSLLALNRRDEALDVMKRLSLLDVRENPELISMSINFAHVLIAADEYRRGAEHAVMLAKDFHDLASPYGKMWMWSGAACGHLFAGDAAAAQPWLAKLREHGDDNSSALMRSLLCANDIPGAAALAVKRLDGDEAEQMLQALHEYQLGELHSRSKKLLDSRWDEVASRPEVQAAVARKGRILSLPLSRIYWGQH